jgi:hypothetical protein
MADLYRETVTEWVSMFFVAWKLLSRIFHPHTPTSRDTIKMCPGGSTLVQAVPTMSLLQYCQQGLQVSLGFFQK